MRPIEADQGHHGGHRHIPGEVREAAMEERTSIMPNDTVLHKPTGETWVVCGVNSSLGTLIPCGYPFPSMARLEDCELVERGYEKEPQSEDQIKALQKHGMTSYIDARSAMFHGIV